MMSLSDDLHNFGKDDAQGNRRCYSCGKLQPTSAMVPCKDCKVFLFCDEASAGGGAIKHLPF